MQQLRWLSRALCSVKRANFKKLTSSLIPFIAFLKWQNSRDEEQSSDCQELRRKEGDWLLKGSTQDVYNELFCLDCGGDHKSLCNKNCIETLVYTKVHIKLKIYGKGQKTVSVSISCDKILHLSKMLPLGKTEWRIYVICLLFLATSCGIYNYFTNWFLNQQNCVQILDPQLTYLLWDHKPIL